MIFFKQVHYVFKCIKRLKSLFCNLKNESFLLYFHALLNEQWNHCLRVLVNIVLTLSEKYVSPSQNWKQLKTLTCSKVACLSVRLESVSPVTLTHPRVRTVIVTYKLSMNFVTENVYIQNFGYETFRPIDRIKYFLLSMKDIHNINTNHRNLTS